MQRSVGRVSMIRPPFPQPFYACLPLMVRQPADEQDESSDQGDHGKIQFPHGDQCCTRGGCSDPAFLVRARVCDGPPICVLPKGFVQGRFERTAFGVTWQFEGRNGLVVYQRADLLIGEAEPMSYGLGPEDDVTV